MIEIKNIRAVVTDIEGTTSSLSFVKEVLFPYSKKHLAEYVRKNEGKLGGIFEEVRQTESKNLSTEEIIKTLLRWSDEDKKITPLKTLQGMIWQAGYEAGELQGHIYDDALEALRRWHGAGLNLYIYSSGSVAAQKLLFGHTAIGDLTPLFSGYFDTVTGPKLEAESYEKIASAMAQAPGNILFLSDHEGEIKAAAAAGMQIILVDREKTIKSSPFQTVSSFDEISFVQEKAA